MTIKNELDKLTEKDIYSLLLFALYKASSSEQFSTLSQLSFILDKESLLNLCEIYGGLTIKIPTIQELERFLNALLLYKMVDIENKDYVQSINSIKNKNEHCKTLEEDYDVIKECLKDYKFDSGR